MILKYYLGINKDGSTSEALSHVLMSVIFDDSSLTTYLYLLYYNRYIIKINKIGKFIDIFFSGPMLLILKRRGFFCREG